MPTRDEAARLAGELEDAVARGVDETKSWLASPAGRRFRAIAAQALIISAPLILRHPFFRTPLGRLVEVAGGLALVGKIADIVREWEPVEPATSWDPR